MNAWENGYNPFDPIQDTESWSEDMPAQPMGNVTTHSIRYRILKDSTGNVVASSLWGYNPFDPIQDTESSHTWALGRSVPPRYNPFDPIQDTESYRGASSLVFLEALQPIRSDTGY